MRRLFALLIVFSTPLPLFAQAGKSADLKQRADEIKAKVEAELPSLEQLYVHLHKNPELSHQEEKTAHFLTKELKDVGYDVTGKVGGHGIVAVLRNGDGPTVMIRTDMDGLPVTEKTGVPLPAPSALATRTARTSASCTPAAMTFT